jgi:hypothetical protein
MTKPSIIFDVCFKKFCRNFCEFVCEKFFRKTKFYKISSKRQLQILGMYVDCGKSSFAIFK